MAVRQVTLKYTCSNSFTAHTVSEVAGGNRKHLLIQVAPHEGVELDESECRAYDVEVDEYHPKATRTLFIGNLEKDVTIEDLKKHFEQFGEIIVSNRCFFYREGAVWVCRNEMRNKQAKPFVPLPFYFILYVIFTLLNRLIFFVKEEKK